MTNPESDTNEFSARALELARRHRKVLLGVAAWTVKAAACAVMGVSALVGFGWRAKTWLDNRDAATVSALQAIDRRLGAIESAQARNDASDRFRGEDYVTARSMAVERNPANASWPTMPEIQAQRITNSPPPTAR